VTPLEERLGVGFGDHDLLTLALTHRSYAFEAGGLPTNERLEFLGDAVLGLIVTRRVFDDHPDDPEGRLAKLRAAAVNTQSLARIAEILGVGEAVLLGRGEEQSGGRGKDSILADTMEALIGAVYLDAGLEVATEMVERLFSDLLERLRSRHAPLDYKTALQELVAARSLGVPGYDVTDSGPDHAKQFTAVVSVEGHARGRGAGRSKKEAEQQAAARAYRVLETDAAAEAERNQR
jgi:ribonuclease-3